MQLHPCYVLPTPWRNTITVVLLKGTGQHVGSLDDIARVFKDVASPREAWVLDSSSLGKGHSRPTASGCRDSSMPLHVL